MAQHVWGDLLPGQRRTAAGSGLGVDSEAVLERVAAERTAAGGGEQRVVGSPARSRVQALRTATVVFVSGVIRCLRSLERIVECA
jgi:hypothetical protein